MTYIVLSGTDNRVRRVAPPGAYPGDYIGAFLPRVGIPSVPPKVDTVTGGGNPRTNQNTLPRPIFVPPGKTPGKTPTTSLPPAQVAPGEPPATVLVPPGKTPPTSRTGQTPPAPNTSFTSWQNWPGSGAQSSATETFLSTYKGMDISRRGMANGSRIGVRRSGSIDNLTGQFSSVEEAQAAIDSGSLKLPSAWGAWGGVLPPSPISHGGTRPAVVGGPPTLVEAYRGAKIYKRNWDADGNGYGVLLPGAPKIDGNFASMAIAKSAIDAVLGPASPAPTSPSGQAQPPAGSSFTSWQTPGEPTSDTPSAAETQIMAQEQANQQAAGSTGKGLLLTAGTALAAIFLLK